MLGDGAIASPSATATRPPWLRCGPPAEPGLAIRRHGPTVLLDRDGWLLPPEGVVLVADWRYKGRGFTTYGDAWLAGHMAAQ